MRTVHLFLYAGAIACIGVAACVSDEPASSDSADGGASDGAASDGTTAEDGAAGDGANPGAAPTGVTACAGNAVATVYFPAVAGASSYNLYYRAASESAPGTKVANVTSPAKTPASLVNGAQTFVSISAVVGGVETQRSAEVSVSPYAFTLPHDVLFAAGLSNNAIYAWDSYSTLALGSVPTRSVTGAATGISSPGAGSIAVDPSIGQLYLTSSGSSSIGVWRDAAAITANAAPHHVISGPSTQLAQPGPIAVDRARNILYVANRATPSQILVWNDACNVHDDAAPTAILTADGTNMLNKPLQFLVDETNDRLFAADLTTYKRFDSPSTWEGDASATAPALVLTPQSDAGTVTACDGIAIDATHDAIYFGNRDWGPTEGAVAAATMSTAATGTIAATRIYLNDTATVNGLLDHVINIQVDNADRLFVLRDVGNPARIERWNSASLLNGTATAPNHYVTLASGSATAFVFLP